MTEDERHMMEQKDAIQTIQRETAIHTKQPNKKGIESIQNFLDNPFDYLLYENPLQIPENMRDKVLLRHMNKDYKNEDVRKQMNMVENM
jgi:hypothetical protein